MMLWIGAILAVLLAAAPDFARVHPAGGLALAGGAALLVLPLPLLGRLVRVLPARAVPAVAARYVCAAAITVPAVTLAAIRLVPGFPAPMPLALPAVIATGAGLFGAVLQAGRRVADPGASRLRAGACVASVTLSVLFVMLHLDEGTFAAVRPGTAPLHLALFLGTWAASAALLAPWAAALSGEAILRSATTRRRWLGIAIGGLGVAAGAALLAADRVVLVDLYPGVHRWLDITGLASVAAGLAVLLGPWSSAIGRAAQRIALAVLIVGAGVFVVRMRARSPGLRAELGDTALGKTLLGVIRPARRPTGALPEHPLLRFDQYLDDASAPNPMNILLVTVDALRADQMDARTPFLRALTRRSIRFDRAYTQGTRTALAIGALMTGRYCADLDWRLLIYRSGALLDPAKLTPAQEDEIGGRFVFTTVPDTPAGGMLAERLRRAGLFTMATPYAGKNEFFHKDGAFDHGFDRFADLTGAPWSPPTSDEVAKVAMKQLEEAKDRRFFQWVHFYDPHTSRGDPERYAVMVRAFDSALGELLRALRDARIEDRTIVIVTADHGEALGEHGHRGHATSLYEEQARIPLLVKVPGLRGRRVGAPVALIDVTATIAAAAGADTADLDGVNLWPLILENRYPASRPVFLELFRYYSNRGVPTADLKGVVLGDWKLVQDRLRDTEQLFHLGEDPGEVDNRIVRDAGRGDELRAVLESFMSRAEARHPLP